MYKYRIVVAFPGLEAVHIVWGLGKLLDEDLSMVVQCQFSLKVLILQTAPDQDQLV